MPSKEKLAEVVCPKCGNRFRLDDRLTANIHKDWEREATSRLRRELREEAERAAEQRVRAEFTKQLRDRDEQIRAKDKKLQRVERQLEKASHGAAQEPAQELGLVRQETLQEVLAARFLQDRFSPIATGQRGGDLIQIVRDPAGSKCGSILWESKRGYQSWSKGWVTKLRADQRREGCELGLIVSDVLPNGESSFCQIGDVLACDLSAALYLAHILRERLLAVASVRGAAARRDDHKGAVYDYVSGPFIDYLRSMLEKVVSMKTTLEKEKRAKAADWKQREGEIDGVALDLASLYGDLRGRGAALPPVPDLELPGSEPRVISISATPS